ncbi:hypothetical protein [Erythrobacter ani]|uniref:Lipoprotein n=1 Tax=Erythrobacter ani TaxID=2827235 RepID=A0ABS6SRW5_9SPHN|nr:hypothetical protein [Erythrobacter ani]MBV7267197.1 hypothetical protein [Erythrobacter ani]
MRHILALLAGSLALSACSGADDETVSTEAADDFAARINSSGQGAAAPVSPPAIAPSVAPPVVETVVETNAPVAFTPGTATDPESATCGANLLGSYIGMIADITVRAEIVGIATQSEEIRFLEPGAPFVAPDASSARLNVMLDAQDIIRDVRCG